MSFFLPEKRILNENGGLQSSQSKVQKIRAVGRKVPEVLPGEIWSGEEMLGHLEFPQTSPGMKALAVFIPWDINGHIFIKLVKTPWKNEGQQKWFSSKLPIFRGDIR